MVINKNIHHSVFTASQEFGVRSYLVGGYIRNHLMGMESDDIDIVVEGDSLKVAERVAELLGGRKVVKFPRFNTAKVINRKGDIEFVSARSEVYNKDSRKPAVSFSDIKGDLSRRDFTINAMAARVLEDKFGNIIDPFGGLDDLDKKILRTPLDPAVTYSDDPLRMLRAVRFASVYGLKIEKRSFDSISYNSSRINIVSSERISDEFFKMLGSGYPVKGVWLLYRSGLLEMIFPELVRLKGVDIKEGVGHKENFIHSLKVLHNISKATPDLHLRLAGLFHDIGKPETKYFKKNTGWTFHGHDDLGAKIFSDIAARMKWSNFLTQRVSKIIKLHHRPISLTKEEVTDSGVRRFLFEAGENVEDLMILCRADITTSNRNKLKKYLDNFDKLSDKLIYVEKKDRLRNFKPPVDGNYIMKMLGIKEGSEVGRIKKMITNAVLNGEINNNRRSAVELLKKIKARESYDRQK